MIVKLLLVGIAAASSMGSPVADVTTSVSSAPGPLELASGPGKPKITLKLASTSRLTIGQSLRVSGKYSRKNAAIVNIPIAVQVRAFGGGETTYTTATDAGGNYAITVTLPGPGPTVQVRATSGGAADQVVSAGTVVKVKR